MDEKSRDVRQSAEYSARTVADALKRAAEDLGVEISKLNYEIIKDSSRSVLGLVRTGEAVIRVSLSNLAAVSPGPASVMGTEEQYLTPSIPLPVSAEEVLGEEETPVATDLKGNPPELEKVATETLSALVDKIGLIAAVEVMDRGGQVDPVSQEISPLVLNIVGDDLGVLIGRRGETLRDLQFVARLIVSRRLRVWPNFVVDVESYKAKRVTAIQALAARMADQVRKTHQMAVLEPMPAHERRIIHLALREDADVYTESTGEGEGRKVQILPKHE